MITLDAQSLHAIDPLHGLSVNERRATSSEVPVFLERFLARHQGFPHVVDDRERVAEILRFAQETAPRFKDIVVLGIGGSALGILCLQQSLTPLFSTTTPRLHVLDNIDSALIRDMEAVLSLKDTLFLVISKSGSTVETMAQYFYFQERCADQGLKTEDHFVFVTDPSEGLLRRIAREHPGIRTFDVPSHVGGRFSVLTAVGLLPAALMGLDIDGLLQGARQMRDSFLNPDFEANLPFQLATIQYLLGHKGKTLNVMMPYSQRLIRLADWYRQLLAESIGKALNDKGETVNVGLTPLSALGVTDQHSQTQLYNEGPNDKLILFIEVDDLGPDLPIPNPYPDDPSVSFLKGVTFNRLLQTEKAGTVQSLTRHDRPNLTLHLPRVDAESLGELLMLLQGSVAFLGEFYGINAFDQPGVELSKTLTKQLLTS